MNYMHFIQLLEKFQTSRIKPLPISESCTTVQIPDSFSEMMIDIVYLLEQHFEKLSKGHPIIAVFGLQVTGVAIESELPLLSNRIYRPSNNKCHFCCVLFYLTTHKNLACIREWDQTESLVIDFTSGLVMDKERYFYKLLGSGKKGKIYGWLNKQRLARAWQHMPQTIY